MTSSNSESNPFFVVAIGASAGGVQALESFFSHLPDLPNAAFVVIPHLSPNYRSMMVEIIQRQTQLPVVQVREEMEIEPEKVYVIPPGHDMVLEDGKFHLRQQTERLNYPINIFFESVAQVQKEKAIGILLSGTGSDGNEGIQAISRAGGVALVQSAETAEFTSMPTSAIPSGLIDEILSPQELANTVYDIVRFVSTNNDFSKVDNQGRIDGEKLQEILNILAASEEIDFSHYKVSTLSRRILHRCALTRSTNLDSYISLLQESEKERHQLRQDLLIGATSFFRDPPAWEYIENQVLPQLIDSLASGQQLRIWVSACATGEEAYTMAILVHEKIEQSNKSISGKIFATDLDNQALEVASRGFYSQNIARMTSQERLEKFFKAESGGYQVKRALREMLIFAPHDLTRNAGFSKMHIVCCRNVLIYMQPQLQSQVLRLLHFALAPYGVLFLGSAETLGEASDEFIVLEPRWKIYRKRRDTQLSLAHLSRSVIATPVYSSNRFKSNQPLLELKIENAFRFCFTDQQITCVLVNRNNQPLHIFYDAAKLLRLPTGEVRLDIVDMVPPNLKLPLSTALHRARREKNSVIYTGIQLQQNNGNIVVNLRVGPDQNQLDSEDDLFIILEVESQVVTSTPIALEMDTEAARQLTELEYELQQTRENLQATIEELETTNEEQQATNEELLASNEELQSTNEELQSVNEELYTVNSEYQEKIQELTELNTDMDNLLSSTKIGVVFLDSNLKIRKFTPAATRAINLAPSDNNRPIGHITHNLDCANFIELLEQVINSENTIVQEVSIPETGENLLMQINLYLRQNGSKDGLVISFVNIDELKAIQNQLHQANFLLESLYDGSPVGICVQNQELKYIRVNQALADMNGFTISDHLGHTLGELIPELVSGIEPLLRQVIETREAIRNVEIYCFTPAKPDVKRYWTANYYPIDLLDGNVGVASIINDITELKEIQQQLQQSQSFVQHITDSSPGIIFIYHILEQKVVYINNAVEEILGYQIEEIKGMEKGVLVSMIHPEDIPVIQEYLENFENAIDNQVLEGEYRVCQRDKTWHWFYIRSLIFSRTESGMPQEILGVATNITDRKQTEQELIERNERLEEAISTARRAIMASQSKSNFLANMSHEIRTPLNAILAVSQLLARSYLNPRQRDLLKTLETNSANLLNLINDILDLSKLEAQELKIEPQQFDIYELINNIINSFIYKANEKGIELRLAISPEVPHYLIGDNFRLNQILNNLVMNAIKYTENGQIIITIFPLANQTGSENQMKLYFSIRDTGIGIPPEEQENIFQAFMQVDNDLTRQYKGTGLGLTICRRIVELMGGEIGVESNPGEGATFWFTSIFEIINVSNELPSPSSNQLLESTSISRENFKLLIVEDNQDNQYMLQLILESLGYNQVDMASNGQEALEQLAVSQYDLVLMDCQMPVINGYEATARIREREGDERHTIIIGLTAYSMLGDREKCLEAGMDDYLAKPLQMQELEEVLKKYCSTIDSSGDH